MNNIIRYIKISACPLCNSNSFAEKKINLTKYYFAGFHFAIPANGINLRHCKKCGLYFKDKVPSQKSFENFFKSHGSNVWKNKSDSFKDELQFIVNKLKNKKNKSIQSLIDIGSSDGNFIKKILNLFPKVSGLDIAHDKECASIIKKGQGEYLNSFIEKKRRLNSYKYYFVSVFDVFEHLYNPNLAAKHFHDLMLPKANLFGETGNADVIKIPENWWYVKYLEHHIFWNQSSLKFFAKKNNFKVKLIKKCAHKRRRYMNPVKKFLLMCIYLLHSFIFIKSIFFYFLKKDISLIGNVYTKDHIFFSMEKIK
jgi:2-polyprenyl-3-methyl-5-hydroxy-6-metoxy-1,4-benzoquinol methylase